MYYQKPPRVNTRDMTTLAHAKITIYKPKLLLVLSSDDYPIYQYPVAIGKKNTPTPNGEYHIANKIYYPGGLLGSRWLGLDYDAYGIHGTNRPWSIGTMASNGCIRMYNHHVETLFDLVTIGTPVFIRD